jgi:hypothetical protein
VQQFVAKHAEHVIRTLSGVDRLVFRGTMRALCSRGGLMSYLWSVQVRLTDFAEHVLKLTEQLKDASLSLARQRGRPVLLSEIARSLNPPHETISAAVPKEYYWSTYQSEWATGRPSRSGRLRWSHAGCTCCGHTG